ncbi:hypothetical protein CNY89_00185 [Amaricoccus sp. HAR-UPW-R2A-40]|nr:hypothetical protein CNY89_00185 [Amaricoccus sp. HAR-UPW-R2A-40]
MTATFAFEVGQTYWTRSAVSYDTIISIEVAGRTAQTLVTKCGKTLRIAVCPYTGSEKVKPRGTYSMCPVIFANQPTPVTA